jgi:hypothetical protein
MNQSLSFVQPVQAADTRGAQPLPASRIFEVSR